MTQVPAGRKAGPTTLVFQAPPSRPEDDIDELDDIADLQAPPTDNRGSRTGSGRDLPAARASCGCSRAPVPPPPG